MAREASNTVRVWTGSELNGEPNGGSAGMRPPQSTGTGRSPLRVSVCIPARNEAATVGTIVNAIVTQLVVKASAKASANAPADGALGTVHEVIVIDDSSTDDTGLVSARAGASVVRTAEVLADQPAGSGKGNAMWAGLRSASGDIVVFCDADLESFTPRYITRLVEPLIADQSVMLVKAFYQRPIDAHGEGGGRTTELLARPLLSLLFPVLATLRQPLSGEFAIRRSVATSLPMVQGYGVEAGLLIDVLQRYGADSMVQVDVGTKHHRHRSIAELAVQAHEIASVILSRAGAVHGKPAHAERPPLDSLTAPHLLN